MLNKIKSKLINLYRRCVYSRKWKPFINGGDEFYYANKNKTFDKVPEVFFTIFYKSGISDKYFLKLYNNWKEKVSTITINKIVKDTNYFIIIRLDMYDNVFKIQVNTVKFGERQEYVKEKEYEFIAEVVELRLIKELLDSRVEVLEDLYF